MAGSTRAALALAETDYDPAKACAAPVFFDRGRVEAAVALAQATGTEVQSVLDGTPRYATTVFLVPPWPETSIDV